MRESIEIRNLGPVKSLVLDDIRPMTVFIGKSATGKSTIMKVVALFRYIFKLANIRSYFHLSNISRSPFRIDFRSLVKENGLESMITTDTKVKYSVEAESGASYTIEYVNRKLQRLPDVQKEDLVFLKGVFVSENRNAISSWLGNGLERRGLQMGFYFDETLDLFLAASQTVKEMELPYIGVSFSVSKASNGGWQYSLRPQSMDERPFKLKEASSGMKSTVPLALIVKYMAEDFNFKDAYRRSVLDYLIKAERLVDFQPAGELSGFKTLVSVHVEEPELSLDPASQLLLQDFIVDELFRKAASDRRCMLMYATHSPYLANHINLLMAEWEKDHNLGVNPDNVDVLLTTPEGRVHSVMVKDEHGRKVVDSEFLAKDIEEIYSQYESLRDR